jgi:hypothetical protein
MSSSRVPRALRRGGIAVLLELAALGLLGLLVGAARWQRRRHQAPATP